MILSIYDDRRTVFRLTDIAMITGITNFQSLNQKIHYQVKKGSLLNPRKGIYAKPGYSREELACNLFTPSYISLEYVLQKEGIVFQYDSRITSVSYLARTVEVSGVTYRFRKLKGEILTNPAGIHSTPTHVNIATAERALLDLMYLSPDSYPDNPHSLDKDLLDKLLSVYGSEQLARRIHKLLRNG